MHATAFPIVEPVPAPPSTVAGLPSRSTPPGGDVQGPVGAIPRLEGYQVGPKLGAGGMGTVWRAWQLSTRREVALKLLNVSTACSEKAKARFDREVEIASNLQHPHIARIYDSGIHQGIYFYAMELIDGDPLDSFVRSKSMPLREVLQLIVLVCRAIQYAHQRGIIHRDLKPANILVDAGGEPHVLDFGLGKFFRRPEHGPSLTIDGEMAGTPSFMSPEQAGGRFDQLDTRTDVYSLGVILYLVLTNHLPHDPDGGNHKVIRRVLEEDIIRPRKFLPQIDADLESLLYKTLARNSDDRYPSVGAMADDVENYLKGDPLTARAPTVFYFLRKKVRKHRLVLGASAAVLITMFAAALHGTLQVVRGREVAEQAAKIQKNLREDEQGLLRISELRRAEGLIAWAGLLGDSERWSEAGEKYWQAKEIQKSRGVNPIAAETGLLDAYQHAPMMLSECQSPPHRAEREPLRRLNPFFSDGRTISWCVRDGTIHSLDIVTGRQLNVVGHPLDNGLVLAGLFQPVPLPQDRVVYGTDRFGIGSQWAVEEIDRAGDQVGRRVVVSGTFPPALALSPDGNHFAFTRGFKTDQSLEVEVVLQEMSGLSPARALEADEKTVLCLEFSADSRRLAGAGRAGRLSVWDVASGKLAAQFDAGLHPASSEHANASRRRVECLTITALAWAPKGDRILVGDANGAVALCDLDQHKPVLHFRGHTTYINHLAFSSDGRLALSGDTGGSARLWNVASGELLATYATDDESDTLCFSPDGQLILSAGIDQRLKVWSAELGDEPLFEEAGAAAESLAISPDGRLAVSGRVNGHLRISDIPTGRRIHEINLHSIASAVAFADDGNSVVAADGSGRIRKFQVSGQWQPVGSVFELSFPVTPDSVPPHARPGTISVLSSNGTLALGLSIRGACLWDVTRGQLRRVLVEAPARVGCFSPDGSVVAVVSSDGVSQLTLFDLVNSREQQVPLTLSNQVTAVALSPDVTVAYLGRADGTMFAIDLSNSRQLWESHEHSAQISCISVLPDGSGVDLLLTGAADGTMRLWNASEGRTLRVLAKGDLPITAAVFSNSANVIWANGAESGMTRLWDLSLPQRLRDMEGRHAAVRKRLWESRSDGPAAVELGEWYALRGRFDWAARLLEPLNGGARTRLTAARCQWRIGEFETAAADFQQLLGQAITPEPPGYLKLCRDAAKPGSK